MNRRPDAPDPLSPEERDLANRLQRLGPNDGPSAALDAKILAAAHAAAAQTPRARARKNRWPAWIGIAASLSLAIGIGWQLRPVDKAPEAMSEEAAAASSANAAADMAADSAAAAGSAADSAAAAAPADAATVELPITEPPPPPKGLVPEPVTVPFVTPLPDVASSDAAGPAPIAPAASPPAPARASAAQAQSAASAQVEAAQVEAAQAKAVLAKPQADAASEQGLGRTQYHYSEQEKREDARAVPAPIVVSPPPPSPEEAAAGLSAPSAPASAAQDAAFKRNASAKTHNAPSAAPQGNARRVDTETTAGKQPQGLTENADAVRERRNIESKAVAGQATSQTATTPTTASAPAPAAAADDSSRPTIDAVVVTGSRTSGGYVDDRRLPVAEWLDHIRSYRDSDQTERARESLREFRRIHPRHRIPEDLRPLLK